MGKNPGGKQAKRHAREPTYSGKMSSLRVSEDECEKYAIVTKMHGNGCNVHCIDNTIRLCIIRGKFQGRGKSTNLIAAGTWVLVGTRSWESVKEKSIEKCDLLEVYSNIDKERLKSSTTKVNWSILMDNDVTNVDKMNGVKQAPETFAFMSEKEQDYAATMEIALSAPTETITLSAPTTVVDKTYVVDI
jgi:hypothetical protein